MSVPLLHHSNAKFPSLPRTTHNTHLPHFPPNTPPLASSFPSPVILSVAKDLSACTDGQC